MSGKFIIKNYLYLLLFVTIEITILAGSLLSLPNITSSVQPKNKYSVYLVKNHWHTGIILSIDSISMNSIPALQDFRDFSYVDIGWGDEDFYQHPDFDLWLAAKALLFPTESVVRVEGVDSDLKKYLQSGDYAIKIDLDEKSHLLLNEFINSSFQLNKDLKNILTSTNFRGKIKFYKSQLKYHLFNTCNTWIAEALRYSGLMITNTNVITAHNLYIKVKKFGEVIKTEEY